MHAHLQCLVWHRACGLHLKALHSAGLQPLLRPRKVLAALHANAGCAESILCSPAGLLAGLELRFIFYSGSPAAKSPADTLMNAYATWRVVSLGIWSARMGMAWRREGEEHTAGLPAGSLASARQLTPGSYCL